MLPFSYDPKTVESDIYKRWEASGFFNPDTLKTAPDAKPYVVYMPLPNVTGTLHMGHALDNTIPDVLVRYHRMKGYKTLWLPGTDHAGIATQYVVEKQLKKEGVSRFELGREKFIERVWEWKREYGNAIFEQLKKLGCSVDWSRARFTMDEAYAKDVLAAFMHYHAKGLIYRGTRTVNWCTRCATSLSELELEYRDDTATLWYIRYSDAITVATTRPETMLGDTAVAVNPTDERYRALVGKTVTLPLVGRVIPIVADELIDPKFGTGALKVTPAHSITDFEIGVRHTLETICVINERGRMTEDTGVYAGMKTAEAREKIVADLERAGYIVKTEPYPNRLATCYRCASTIEPIPSAQWFLKMDTLAQRALEASESGAVHIRPDTFKKMYSDWLSAIRDWAISRQIWWGHRLPVWFCTKDKEQYLVAITKPAQCPFCHACDMEQSPDVLDTWFSSALWPFAGLSDADQKKYYPGNLVSNARDILNLWDARMIFSGLELKGAVPFTEVLIHGTVLTKDGKRMSKSLGTGIDPMRYIDTYGSDATRFAVIWQATGQDIKWDETAVIGGKKFLNKVWNASRFVFENAGVAWERIEPKPETEADRTILAALKKMKIDTAERIVSFECSAALHELYNFMWHTFCDTYIERAKEQIRSGNAEATKTVLRFILSETLVLLHPFIPFITEELYQQSIKLQQKTGAKNVLMVESW